MPTAAEADLLATDQAGTVALCGFGLAAAGAGAAHAIALHAPTRVILVGCAGSYDLERAPIGSVVVASAVRCHGIGVGALTPAELGWAASDQVELDGDGGLVLSVASASETVEEAAIRLSKHPDAIAEEMEGYSVALAAIVYQVPLTVVRGISNRAGDRDKAAWRMPEALAAAGEAVATMLG